MDVMAQANRETEKRGQKRLKDSSTGNGKRRDAHLRHYLRWGGVGPSAGRGLGPFAFFSFGNDNLGLP